MTKNISEMICLDIYLSNLNEECYNNLKYDLFNTKLKPMPLKSWDFFMVNYQNRLIEAKKQLELNQVKVFANKYNWQNDLQLAFKEQDYEALIITDENQKIIWVNDGFSSMTGYSKKFALNKTHRFLQGIKTDENTKSRIRKKIALNKPFKDIIINHRKDNSTYKCEVNIIPLYNKTTTHFIAFERQIG